MAPVHSGNFGVSPVSARILVAYPSRQWLNPIRFAELNSKNQRSFGLAIEGSAADRARACAKCVGGAVPKLTE